MAEDPTKPRLSSTIALGLVFFGQLVDHDVTRNQSRGQGPSSNAERPVNVRTPALDLDSVYGEGPLATPQYYTEDGLFFRLGRDDSGLLRDENGRAIIPDDRDDENAFVAAVHLAFQKFHNVLAREALGGADPGSLSPEQRQSLFTQVREQVIGFYQGIVANQMATAFAGGPVPDGLPPIDNIPVEFSSAAFRLGHTLVPNRVVIDERGTARSPVDPGLRDSTNEVPLALLFGPKAQPSAAFDDKIAPVMLELLIPASPTDPSQGHFVGGSSPNIGTGTVVEGSMRLNLAETNILRGREQTVASGEEYLAMLQGRAYDPTRDGNTDLWVYILREAAPRGHLGPVGADILYRTIGGIIAADPYRYNNPDVFGGEDIERFRRATVEQLLGRIGTPGFR